MLTLEHLLPRAPPLAPAEHRAPTPLLAHIAGEHAEGIARLWAAPHGEFLALPAARRHLAAIGLFRVRGEDYARLRALIEHAPLRDALAFVFGYPPRGMARALTRLGETLWTQTEYAQLHALLGDMTAEIVLRHADVIDPQLLARLAILPAPLREARILRNTQNVTTAHIIAEAFDLARRINPRRSLRDLVLAWARAQSPYALARLAMDALKPDRFVDHGPPPVMPRPYRAIASKAGLAEVALRFRNCVEGYVWEIGAGTLALYVWEGEPASVIALRRDVGGWRLAEALAAGNDALDETVLRHLAADFAAADVRIGPPVRAVEDRLETIADAVPTPAPLPETLAQRWGLGQLWR